MIHTDRGKQFLSKRFTTLFEDAGAKISVGERGFKDNIVMERFWRSYKTPDEVFYGKEYNKVAV